jgi:cobalt/nickel transport protein
MNSKKKAFQVIAIIAAIVALAVVPLFVAKDAEFGGADDAAESAILSIRPDYIPWFSSLLEPKSAEIESLLFSLQAAIGSGIVFYGVGYLIGKGKKDKANVPS